MNAIQYIIAITIFLNGVVNADVPKSKLLFLGGFTSAWNARKDGTTAMLYQGKMKWEYKDDYGKVRGNLDASSYHVSIEPQKGTVYKLFYANSKEPYVMKASNIIAILQEAKQRRITKAHAINPVIKINENGHMNLSASMFVFYTSLELNEKSKAKLEKKAQQGAAGNPLPAE